MIWKGCIPYRPHDYMYDPIFTVSGPVDHYKAAITAKMSAAKFQLCPIFANMFSDLPNHPRVQLVQRRQKPILTYEEKVRSTKKVDPATYRPVNVAGADRSKFFCPIVNLPPKQFTGLENKMPRFTLEKVERKVDVNKTIPGQTVSKNTHVQTLYRDSYAQTIPWEPPYKIIGEGEPEVLKLDFLNWAKGSSAGVHEVQLIERARMKRAWQNTVQPDINDEDSLQRFRDFVEALERDEWAFREKEIQEIQDLRLHLLEKMLEEIHEQSYNRSQEKLDRFIQIKQAEKEQKLEKIRRKAARELRKLELKERKYHETDIIQEHTSKASELYGPLMRNGENPKRWHQVIDQKMERYKAQFIGVEQFSTLPRWLDQATKLKETYQKPKSDGPTLCIRETKWTTPVLKQLYEELQNLKLVPVKTPCSLRVRTQKQTSTVATPEVEGIPKEQEEHYQAVVHLQSIIEGRATQMLIYEGRDNCRELIQELKYSVGLLNKDKEQRTKEKLKVRMQQREETIQSVMVSRLQGTLGKLQGQVVGSLLDFLNKELRRLLEERKAHAMCWVNERERNIREAAEAGRRQKEIRRRREHDEIFRQIVKVTQESVDVYLQDIITEGMNFATKDEATTYVLGLADKIEKEITTIDQGSLQGLDQDEELVADLVHHFVLPEVEKKIVRERLTAQQKQKLKIVHENIYHKLENLPKIEPKVIYNDNSLFSSSPTIEHYQYKLEEWSQTDPSVTPLTGTLQNTMVSTEEQVSHPDVLELYLNMLAAQDDFTQREDQHPFDIKERIPEINKMRNYQPFNNDLDTIPETENETSETGSGQADLSSNNVDDRPLD